MTESLPLQEIAHEFGCDCPTFLQGSDIYLDTAGCGTAGCGFTAG